MAWLLALGACTAETPTDGDTGESAEQTAAPATDLGEAEVVADALEAPWSLTFVGDTALISERDSARILELDADGNTREVGTIEGVQHGGEGGLLGITVHDGDLFVYSTAADGNRIQRYELTGDPGGFGLGDPDTLLEGIPASGTHNGGRVAVGPDGMLYATVGDAGERDAAQDPALLAGSILRMTPDGEVPEDNPSAGSYVYSYGHRNPQGIAWDQDGTMYASEFGQDTWDELNIIEPGANYGWPEVEGMAEAENTEDFVDPVQQWTPAEASPSGITVHEDSLYIASLRGERLYEVPLADPAASAVHLDGENGRLRDAATAPDGSLWVLTNNTDGRGEPRDGDDRVLRVGG